MKFLSLFVAAVAATKLRSKARFGDDVTPQMILQHCDEDQNQSISVNEAHRCLDNYLNHLAHEQAKPIHDQIDAFWPQLAGADGEATLTELEAAFANHQGAATALAQMRF